MIRVTIEVWPKGSASLRKLRGFMDIINDGTGNKSRSSYRVNAYTAYRNQGRLIRQFEIKNHPRQAQSIWLLLKKVFEAW